MKNIQKYAFAVALALGGACSGPKAEGAKPTSVGSVNGAPVSQARFDAFLKLKRKSDASDAAKQNMLSKFLEREALAGVIEKQPESDTALIEAEINEFRKQALINRYFDSYLSTQVDDVAVQNYYDSHVKEYEQRKVEAAHILVRTSPKTTEKERAAKFTKVQEAFGRLGTGEAFEKVAKALSEDSLSAAKGGSLGFLKAGAIDARFSKVLFETAEGTFTEPFESSFGFHIVKILSAPQVVRQPLETVRGDIRYRLRAEAKAAETKRLLAEMKVKMSAKEGAK